MRDKLKTCKCDSQILYRGKNRCDSGCNKNKSSNYRCTVLGCINENTVGDTALCRHHRYKYYTKYYSDATKIYGAALL